MRVLHCTKCLEVVCIVSSFVSESGNNLKKWLFFYYDPSLSDPEWQCELIWSDFCNCFKQKNQG